MVDGQTGQLTYCESTIPRTVQSSTGWEPHCVTRPSPQSNMRNYLLPILCLLVSTAAFTPVAVSPSGSM